MPEGTETSNTTGAGQAAAASAAAGADGKPVNGAAATAGAGEGAPPAAGAAPAAGGDWRSGLEGEALEFAKRLTSPQDAVKSALDIRKTMSGMVKVPGKDASPEDVAKFSKLIGAGEKVEDYKFPEVEGADPVVKTLQGKVAEVMLKHHASTAMTGELAAVVNEVGAAYQAEQDRVALEGRKASEAQLRKDWGGDFEGNGVLAKHAARAAGLSEAFVNKIVDGVKIGDHPDFVRAWGTVGRGMGMATALGEMGGDNRKTLVDTIAAKQKEFHEAYNKGDRARAQALNAELLALRGQLDGNQPIVGSAGRTL